MKKVININFQGRVVPIEESAFELLKQYTDSLRNYFSNEEGRDEIINDIESRIAELFEESLKNGATCITDADVNIIINNMGRPQDFAAADSDTASSANEQKSYEYQQPGFGTGKKLYRDENNKLLGGVCSGIAAYFNIEPIIVRLVFVFSGIGFFAYLLLWAFVPGSENVHNGVKKRLYRNPDNKFIAGVCSGIATYFNINVWIPRVLFLLPFISFLFRWRHYGPFTIPHFLSFSFSPGTFIVYVILWMVLPEASTTSEKLEMKGEKVDLESIKNSVIEEMKEVKERMGRMGTEARAFAEQRGGTVGKEMGATARKVGSSFGDIIAFIAKMFAYFIVGCVAFALIVALFALAVCAIGLFPLKSYLLNDGWQNVYAWGTLLFFIAVPVIGIITFIVRRIAKIKRRNSLMRYSFLALWVLGIFCFISLFVSVAQDFKSSSTINELNIPLANPQVSKMRVTYSTNPRYFSNHGWLHFEPFANFDEDTAYVNNVRIRIIQSPNDSFKVSLLKMCNGYTRKFADTLASKIDYPIVQVDSLLTIGRGIGITPQDKFRNQHVVVTIAVPVGKVINLSKKIEWRNWEHFNGPWNNDNYDWENTDKDEIEGWENHYGEDLIMRKDGLYTVEGRSVKVFHGNSQETIDLGPDVRIQTDDNNRDSVIVKTNDIDSLKNRMGEMKMKLKDRTLKLKDSLQKVKESIDKKIERLNDSNTMNEKPIQSRDYGFMLNI
ncbi:MAG: hypothetical protein NVSMB45_02360 [Ginsengibacter sp.]